MTKAALFLSLCLTLPLAGCATRLTAAGRTVKVIHDDAVAVAGCLRLGPVRGEAGSLLSGGRYGVVYATYDARNKAARIPKADTLLITDREHRRLGGGVTGIAYNCSVQFDKRAAEYPENDAPGEERPEVAAPGSDIFAKAKKCQSKGGVWINDCCIVQID